MSDEYIELIKKTSKNIDSIKEERELARYQSLVNEANEKLDEAQKEYDDKKKKADDDVKTGDILEELLKFDSISSVQDTDATIMAVEDMLHTINLVVVILVISSALLDLVVLYNLANINIGERKREIATLKVLGD